MSAQLQFFQQEVQILSPWKSSHRGSRVAVGFDQLAANLASKKLSKSDVRGALKILTSDASYVSPSESAREILALKHPPLPFDRRPAPTPLVAPFNVIVLSLRSFRPGSAGGPDGLKPQHILDMVQGDVSSSWSSALLDFVNLVAGGVPKQVRPYFFGANHHPVRRMVV